MPLFCDCFGKNRAKAVELSESAAFEDTVRTDAACRIQMIVRGELARQRVGGLRASSINSAVVQLQKILRGGEARTVLRGGYNYDFMCSSGVVDMPLEPALAATRIQTMHRRRVARIKMYILRESSKGSEGGWEVACGAAAEAAEVYRALSATLPCEATSQDTVEESAPRKLNRNNRFFYGTHQKAGDEVAWR